MKVVWTCKDGTKIPINELGDQHLLNIIAMYERKYDAIQLTPPPMFQGEMAQFYADREYNDLMTSTIEDLFPIYGHMIKEAKRRKIHVE